MCSDKNYFVNRFFQLDSRPERWPIRIVIAVRGFRPRCIWYGVIFSVFCGVCLIVLIAKWTLSSNVNPTYKLARSDSIVRMVLSTNPAMECKYVVHRIRSVVSPSVAEIFQALLSIRTSVAFHYPNKICAKFSKRSVYPYLYKCV